MQIDQIDNMVSQGVKGLIIIAEDGDALSTAVSNAKQAGVVVLAYTTGSLACPDTPPTCPSTTWKSDGSRRWALCKPSTSRTGM
ncbi:MAG: substrate-binding domain-containing protein [Ardenticatenaceae bacterium]|nr:substrate-binding domain-containing protein [Ardenticatenaceae bacterium]